jgi:hypothetical protein
MVHGSAGFTFWSRSLLHRGDHIRECWDGWHTQQLLAVLGSRRFRTQSHMGNPIGTLPVRNEEKSIGTLVVKNKRR